MDILEDIKEIGVIRYHGELGPSPKTPTYSYNGILRGFPPGTDPKIAVLKMCNEFHLDYESVVNPYYGMTYVNKIAACVTRKMKKLGFGYELCFGIALSHLKASLTKISGVELTESQYRSIAEGDYVEELRQKCIAEAYNEFPPYYSYSYGYDYTKEYDYNSIFE